MLLLIGPAVAVIGIVAVVFVMRHKSVEKRSMYSSRRSQIEHKVRAARQRTLAGRHAEKAGKDSFDQAAAAAPAPTLTYEPSAYAAPPVAPPPKKGRAEPTQPAWESEPTAPAPSPPPFAQPAPAPEPPAYEPPAYEPPAYQPPAAEPPAWSPTAPAPEPERATPVPAAVTPAGAGASWSVVGETKASAEPAPDTKKKKSKGDAQGGAWSLASGEPADDEVEAGPKSPSAFIAVAQYAVLVVGLVMVLIGVVVMVANSHGS
jgi:hypothetical protein